VLSGLGRSISHALVPPGLDRPPPLLLVSKGCCLQALVGGLGRPFARIFNFRFSCSKFVCLFRLCKPPPMRICMFGLSLRAVSRCRRVGHFGLTWPGSSPRGLCSSAAPRPPQAGPCGNRLG
jgi:hypothetical protein